MYLLIGEDIDFWIGLARIPFFCDYYLDKC